MRRSLVTGGAGFIGSHLVEALLSRGDEVVALDDLSTGRRENLAAAEENARFRFVEGSVLDEAVVRDLVSAADRVFHLAAAVGVMLVLERQVRSIETNVGGTENVLRAAAARKTPVLVASSSEVCGKGHGEPFREDDDVALGPTSRFRWSYATSKALDEFLALAWHREAGLPVVAARFFNTVGPRQVGRYGMVVPRFIGQALAGGPITVFGDGSQSRAFAWVGDVVGAAMALLEAPAANGLVVNVGTDEEVTILGLAERVRSLVNPAAGIRLVPYSEAYPEGFEDLGRRVPDLSRVRSLIGYRPSLSLDDILRRTLRSLR